MPKICYVPRDFSAVSTKRIEQANEIIDEYQAQGLSLTLRQLYYQFVARDLLPNTQNSYKSLGATISDARLAGLVDWNALVDRTRRCLSNSHWSSPGEGVRSLAAQYQIDKWMGQTYHVEVWVEKEALVGVFETICSELDVPWFACRGYVSQSAMWRAAQRLLDKENGGKKTVILHFGDHDPSGLDMTRDIEDRLQLFRANTQVDRLALTPAQIQQYDPPPNPAKTSDSRFGNYRQEHGDESWELDALEPRVLRQLVERGVKQYRDDERWEKRCEEEEWERDELYNVADELGG